MKVILRKALPDDYEQIAFVHYKAWLETYTGILPESFLKNRTLESSINIFKNNLCSNTVVAIVEGKIIGFCGWGPLRNNSFEENFGEIHGIYLLDSYKKHKIGRKMLEFALEKLSTKNYPKVGLWVLSSNENAIHFYKKLGFSDTGIVKEENLGEIITESFFTKEI